MATLVEVVFPAILVFTMLFGLLARGNPRPGGVALFVRVGLAGLAIGGGLWFLTFKTGLLDRTPGFVKNAYSGVLVGGLVLFGFGILGTMLKRRPS